MKVEKRFDSFGSKPSGLGMVFYWPGRAAMDEPIKLPRPVCHRRIGHGLSPRRPPSRRRHRRREEKHVF